MVSRRNLRMVPAVGLALGALTLVGCGGSDSDSGSSGESATADTAAADKILAPYTGKPSAFPVDEPLAKRPSPNTQVEYLQCVTPICGLIGSIAGPAAKTMGVKLKVVKAGGSAEQLQGAMQTIITDKPDAVLVPAVEPDSINVQLKELAKMKIPVTSNGIMNHEKYGIGAANFNTETAVISGKILAAWVVKNKGAKANVAFYLTPELSFGKYIQDSFTSELKKLCAACKVRSITIPVGTIGSTAPSKVVSDLQANPDTTVGVFSTEEAAVGLPAAMKTAGLKTTIAGFGPNPANLQDIKSGGITMAVGLAFPVMVWTQLDEAIRLAQGEPLTKGEKAGVPPLQVLEKKNINFDPSKGFAGYPDFAQRFAKLWKGQ